jgi:hypothetical protein
VTNSRVITNTDASGQGYLFPPASPLPGRNPAADEQAEIELLVRAQEFAFDLITRKQGSTAEFVEALITEFGAGVKILLIDLVKGLAQDKRLKRLDRDYVTSYLQPADIEKVTDS